MNEADEATFVRHLACSACGSSDANALYSDGHTHCFNCKAYGRPEGAVAVSKGHRMSVDLIEGETRSLPKRGLGEAVCQKFGYTVGTNRAGKTVQIANYRNKDGHLVAQHTRTANKDFAWVGDHKDIQPLWGAHLWQAGGKRIVVTEGELDCMSVAQAFGLSWPVVSLPNGASNAKKSIMAALEYLETFEQVVLGFDTDEAGRAATAECAPLFSPGKCAVAEWTHKDANDVLQAGGVKAVCGAVYQARIYRPDGIVSLSEIRDRVLMSPETGRPWFLPGLTKASFGRRIGDVIGLGAATGAGKTDFLAQQIVFDVMDLKIPVGAIFLEQGVGETGKRMAGKMAGKRFHIPDGSWSQGELDATWGTLEATNRLHLYDAWGAADWDVIAGKIRYLVASLGCQHIYLDHLTALAAAEEDERKALERIMSEAAGMAKSLGFILHYVSHLTTPEGKPHEEGGRVKARDFKGARAIAFWSHFMFGLERDTQAPGTPTTLRCIKDRFTGNATGMTWGLQYDRDTGLLHELAATPEQEGPDDSPF